MPEQVITPGARAGLSIPDYELLRPIGRGAYGEVWLARNVTGSWVALKIVHRSAFDHDRPFEREFEGIKRFEPISRSDPSQVAILHVGLGEGFFYYVMELADAAAERSDGVMESRNDGKDVRLPDPNTPSLHHSITPASYAPKTLKRLLNDRDALPAQECLTIGLSLTRALAHLHGHGLVHRDVKPSNVIFVKGQAKLADIGLVTSLDATRSFVGTEGYLPPEGAGTPQADLYSLGKMLYEMSTGCDRKEFPALPPDIATRPDRDALAELNAIIVRACQLEPHHRYQAAEEMSNDLNRLGAGHSIRRHHAWQRNLNRTKKLAMTLGAFAIVSMIGYQLANRPARPSAIRWSRNAEANEAYQHGSLAFQQDAADSEKQAVEYFSRAIDLDPNFARANARLAITLVWMGPSDPEKLKKARQFAEKALSLDPSLADAHHAVGAVKGLLEHDWIGQEKQCREAIRLDPNSEENYYNYATFLSFVGRTNEALRQLETARKFDSHSIRSLQWAAFIFERTRQYAQVIKKTEELFERVPSTRADLTARFLVPAYREAGDYATAIGLEESCDPLLATEPDQVKLNYQALQTAFDECGSRGYWKLRLEWYMATHDESNPVQLALLYARVGDKERAFYFLYLAVEKMPVQLCFVISTEPGFDSLRSDHRFAKVLKTFGLSRTSRK